MRVFISEYVCGGAWAEGVPAASLLREGHSMLRAIVADAAQIAGCSVVTTWDARLGAPGMDGIAVVRAGSPDDERRVFERLSAECDATLVIAPEFDGILLHRRSLVDRAGGHFVGPDSGAIALCSDKLQLAEHLQRCGIASIPTALLDGPGHRAVEFPLVIKPRDGAGSQRTFLVHSLEALDRARRAFERVGESGAAVAQPYVPGRALSVAVVASAERRQVETLPVAEQRLSDDGRFQYLGGCIPARIDSSARERIEALVRRACACIDGLNGYAGFDVILPEVPNAEPLIVEVNPRLTTSYLGYRALAGENLAERILAPGHYKTPIRWKRVGIRFTPDGRVDC